MKWTVYAHALGTYFATVDADSAEEAIEKAVDFTLCDTPEVGGTTSVLCDDSGEEWSVDENGTLSIETANGSGVYKVEGGGDG